VTIQLGFSEGSIGTIHYLANGSKAFSKERLEVFAQGRLIQLDNFRKLNAFGCLFPTATAAAPGHPASW